MISSIPRPWWGQLSYFHFTAEGGAEELVLGSWPSQKKKDMWSSAALLRQVTTQKPIQNATMHDLSTMSVACDASDSWLPECFGGVWPRRLQPAPLRREQQGQERTLETSDEFCVGIGMISLDCQSASWLERRILFDRSLKSWNDSRTSYAKKWWYGHMADCKD